jgi:hypothetical protein
MHQTTASGLVPIQERENTMANWQYKINFRDESTGYEDGSVSIQGLAECVNKKILSIKDSVSVRFPDEVEDLLQVAELFSDISMDPDSTVEDFDNALEQLYDWGDTSLDNKWNGRKLCWIEH